MEFSIATFERFHPNPLKRMGIPAPFFNALLGDSLATPEIVQANLITALQMMDRAVPEVMAVAFGDQTALQVITEADTIDADDNEAPGSPLQ